MKKTTKFYIFLTLFLGLSAAGFSQTPVNNYYENTVSSTVCEGDSNIIKAGCSVAVGQVVRVTPGIVTGVTLDKMGTCYEKYGEANIRSGGDKIVVDLNDTCNQLAMFNPKMERERYAYIPINEDEMLRNGKPGIASLTIGMDMITRKTSKGLFMDNGYFASKTFENVPYLKTTFAATPSTNASLDAVTKFVYSVWLLSRNIAYVVLLVAALALGIVIMIGNQGIDKEGKTKLSVERAIPRVVIAVILISSSYWIGSLVINSLIGGGIVQGFAAFFAQALFPVNANTAEQNSLQIIFTMSLSTVLFGIATGLLSMTAGGATIPILLGILYTVWKIILLYVYQLKNLFDVLMYIIYSPFLLVGGVSPSDNTYKAFKEYANKLVYFVIYGFILNLIVYGSKAIAAYTTLIAWQAGGTGTTINAFEGLSNVLAPGAFSFMLASLIGLIGYVYIISLAKNAEGWATTYAEKIIPFKEKKDKDKDKD